VNIENLVNCLRYGFGHCVDVLCGVDDNKSVWMCGRTLEETVSHSMMEIKSL
jgi:hypothetical protein